MVTSLISFADSRLSLTARRFEKQANSLDTFDVVKVFSEEDFPSDFRVQFQDYLVPGIRGFGYWVWKPWIIKTQLESLNDGDLLVYSDVGFTLRPEGITRLNEYLRQVSNTEQGVLLFQAIRPTPDSPVKDDGRSLPAWFDRYWTKVDLLDHFGVRHAQAVIDTPQIQSGLIFIRKCPTSVSFINKWFEVFETDFHLVDDSPSNNQPLRGFREHRHDQSVLSVLGKMHGVDTVSSTEFWMPNKWTSLSDWDALEATPFHANRDLNFGTNVTKTGANKDVGSKLALRSLAYNVVLMSKRIRNLFRPIPERYL